MNKKEAIITVKRFQRDWEHIDCATVYFNWGQSNQTNKDFRWCIDKKDTIETIQSLNSDVQIALELNDFFIEDYHEQLRDYLLWVYGEEQDE